MLNMNSLLIAFSTNSSLQGNILQPSPDRLCPFQQIGGIYVNYIYFFFLFIYYIPNVSLYFHFFFFFNFLLINPEKYPSPSARRLQAGRDFTWEIQGKKQHFRSNQIHNLKRMYLTAAIIFLYSNFFSPKATVFESVFFIITIRIRIRIYRNFVHPKWMGKIEYSLGYVSQIIRDVFFSDKTVKKKNVIVAILHSINEITNLVISPFPSESMAPIISSQQASISSSVTSH